MNMVTQEPRYPGATYQIYSRQCPDPDLFMRLLCTFQQPRIISDHRSLFDVCHAFSGQSTRSTQCLPQELALCNTKYLHFIIYISAVSSFCC